MHSRFSDYIRIGVPWPKEVAVKSFPRGWTTTKESIYNGQKHYAVLTGAVNGILVIDIDVCKTSGKALGLDWFKQIFGCFPESCETLVTSSPSGGYHVFFATGKSKVTSGRISQVLVDIQGDGKCVFQGESYPVLVDLAPQELTELQLSGITSALGGDVFGVSPTLQPQSQPQLQAQASSRPSTEFILDNLTKEWYTDYENWYRVGFALSLEPDGLALFKKFSKRCPEKFSDSCVDEKWKSFTKNKPQGKPVTVHSLKFWLKQCNPSAYKQLCMDPVSSSELDCTLGQYTIEHGPVLTKSKTLIEVSLKKNPLLEEIHDSLVAPHPSAELFTHCTRSGYQVRCAHSECNFEYPYSMLPINKDSAPTIYQYFTLNVTENGSMQDRDTFQVAERVLEYCGEGLAFIDSEWYWYDTDSGIYERKTLGRVRNILNNIAKEMRADGGDEPWLKWMNDVVYKRTLIDELESLCGEVDIITDKNPTLLGFSNGVLDLTNGQFQSGKREWYVTMKCGIPYNPGEDTSLAKEFLEEIFPDSTEREYALDNLCLSLEGTNRKQTFTLNYGFTASNGKSFLMDIVREILGDYAGTFAVNLITSRMKGAGDANPSLASFNKKRHMFCSEPEAGARLNVNFIKSIIGDSITARALYKETVEFKPSFNIYILCNTLPNLDSYDAGIARRVRVQEYRTEFTEVPVKKHQKKIKKYTEKQLASIRAGLLRILIDQYTVLQSRDFEIEVPQQFMGVLSMYLNDNKDVIEGCLTDAFEVGDGTVRASRVKSVMKAGGVSEIDLVTLQKIVEGLFPGVEYIHDTSVKRVRMNRVFKGLVEIGV